MIIVKNYKTIIVPNNSLNPAHPIAVAQAKPQPKDQMRVVIPFKLTAICRPNANALHEALQEAEAHIHALHEALQEAVAHTHALHEALQDTAQLPSG